MGACSMGALQGENVYKLNTELDDEKLHLISLKSIHLQPNHVTNVQLSLGSNIILDIT